MPSGGTRRLRVLLVAEAANPEWVSVPLVGWSHAQALAAEVDALLVTHVRNRAALLRAGLSEGDEADFITIDSDRSAAPLYKAASLLRGGEGKGWTAVTALGSIAYYAFERLLWQRCGRRIRRGEFDLVHRLTPLSPTTPSGLLASRCRRAGVPFVLGPLNGGVPWPRMHGSVRRQEREWLSYVREAYRLMPGYRATREGASAILVGSRDTFLQLDRRFHAKTFYIPENAVDPTRFRRVREGPARRPLRLTFVGRLVPYKGADVLIEAVASLVRSGDVVVAIVGDGPQRPQLEALLRERGISQGVRLVGSVPHGEVQDWLANSDAFAFPSIREFGGGVVLEAMCVGVVPIVVRHGGPAELISPSTGIGIAMGTRAVLIQRLRMAIEMLIEDPIRADVMGAAARERVLQHFTWAAKARQVRQVYEWTLRRAAEGRPRFAMPTPDGPPLHGL